jgi:hypothetical protein
MHTEQIGFILIIVGVLSLSVSAQVIPKKGSTPQRIYGLTVENLDELDVDEFREKFRGKG